MTALPTPIRILLFFIAFIAAAFVVNKLIAFIVWLFARLVFCTRGRHRNSALETTYGSIYAVTWCHDCNRQVKYLPVRPVDLGKSAPTFAELAGVSLADMKQDLLIRRASAGIENWGALPPEEQQRILTLQEQHDAELSKKMAGKIAAGEKP